MDYLEAVFIEWVEAYRSLTELAETAKALTWEHYCEHAVVEVNGGRRALVRGGRVGIEFAVEEGGPWLVLVIEGGRYRVDKIVLHTHPMVTGPSDWDLEVLEMLGQEESLLFEIGGDPEGTRIKAKTK